MLEINISEQTEQTLKEIGLQNNQSVADFAGRIVEKEITKNKLTKSNGSQSEKQVTEENQLHPLLKFAGMFSSGKKDVSTRYKEILTEEVDARGGFGGS